MCDLSWPLLIFSLALALSLFLWCWSFAVPSWWYGANARAPLCLGEGRACLCPRGTLPLQCVPGVSLHPLSAQQQHREVTSYPFFLLFSLLSSSDRSLPPRNNARLHTYIHTYSQHRDLSYPFFFINWYPLTFGFFSSFLYHWNFKFDTTHFGTMMNSTDLSIKRSPSLFEYPLFLI